MIKIEFKSAQEMVLWLMDNEGKKLHDNYSREWMYQDFTFFFRDIAENGLRPVVDCLHLFSTDLYHQI